MVTVLIKDAYAEILSAFGELQDTIDLALKRYTIEEITTKVDALHQRDVMYHTRYGRDSPTFARCVAEDASFVKHLESVGNTMWEADLADWEFCYKGMQDWRQTLQHIILT